ncbi:MAG: SPOR domain-containing protein [Gemmatimonadota bacterium]|nr:SPOR domain-containing protein [Gemmatimonadota bacterium]
MPCSISQRLGYLFLGGLLALQAACAAPGRSVVPPATVIKEDFDPQTLDDDDFLLKPPSGAETLPVDQTAAAAPSLVQLDGFRVQIAVVSSRERAGIVRNEAETKLGVPVHVYRDPDTGLHKVHAGNGRTATEVESLRRLAKSQGYPEAFIVRTRIELPRAAVFGPEPVVGFRVQVFATSNRAAAEGEMANVKDTVGHEDVYIESEPPYFKVRIGNFRTREAAEGLIQRLQTYGYDTPFVVRTQIETSTAQTTDN